MCVYICICCCCSVVKSCPTLCNPRDCSMPGSPVLHSPWVSSNSCPLSRWCHPTISSSFAPFFSCPQSLPASKCFPVSQLFASDSQSIGSSASASTDHVDIMHYHLSIMHWTHGWSCTDHVADHALITWLSCPDHVADHALITSISCTDHMTAHALITWMIIH